MADEEEEVVRARAEAALAGRDRGPPREAGEEERDLQTRRPRVTHRVGVHRGNRRVAETTMLAQGDGARLGRACDWERMIFGS